MSAMIAEDRAYLAGLLDGEGHIAARPRRAGGTDMVLEVCMTDVAPLSWAQRVTARGHIFRGVEGRANRRQPYHWKVAAWRDAVAILEEVRPYLKVKWAQATAFIVLGRLRALKSWHYGPPVYPEGEIRAAALVQSLKRADLANAYDEAMDLVVYLRGCLYERDGR